MEIINAQFKNIKYAHTNILWACLNKFLTYLSIANKFSLKRVVDLNSGRAINASASYRPVHLVNNLTTLCLRTFSIVFPKTALFLSINKFFSNSFLADTRKCVFKSMYAFSQADCLNSKIRCTFSILNLFQ